MPNNPLCYNRQGGASSPRQEERNIYRRGIYCYLSSKSFVVLYFLTILQCKKAAFRLGLIEKQVQKYEFLRIFQKMTNLSVNINKIATLRNARGENKPDVEQMALDIESFGADGITVHPRPDERHIKRSDVYRLRPALRCEFNIEGYPSGDFIDLVLKTRPTQVTLVPDAPRCPHLLGRLEYRGKRRISQRRSGALQRGRRAHIYFRRPRHRSH